MDYKIILKTNSSQGDAKMNIIPKPNGVFRNVVGIWNVKPKLHIKNIDFDCLCLESFSNRLDIQCIPSESNEDIILVKDESFQLEEYEIEITKELVIVKASSESGIINALTTLYLCIENGKAPCFVLRDFPKYPHRGLLLDCVRHFFDVSEVKKVIEQISLVKLNKFHWHLTDDQGWRIESKVYPALHDGIPFYTHEEIKEVVRYAKMRNVEVIPEIEMPGHMASAVHVFPWLSCAVKQVKRATSGGIYKAILCAGKEST
jgi:hexosaminidase